MAILIKGGIARLQLVIFIDTVSTISVFAAVVVITNAIVLALCTFVTVFVLSASFMRASFLFAKMVRSPFVFVIIAMFVSVSTHMHHAVTVHITITKSSC